MNRKGKYTAEQFIKIIPGSAGIITAIAQRIGCEWNTAKHYIMTHPSVKQAYDDECEKVLDMAESKLYSIIKDDGDLGAIKYLLSTKGKKRGYIERQEITGEDGKAIEVIHIKPGNSDD